MAAGKFEIDVINPLGIGYRRVRGASRVEVSSNRVEVGTVRTGMDAQAFITRDAGASAVRRGGSGGRSFYNEWDIDKRYSMVA